MSTRKNSTLVLSLIQLGITIIIGIIAFVIYHVNKLTWDIRAEQTLILESVFTWLVLLATLVQFRRKVFECIVIIEHWSWLQKAKDWHDGRTRTQEIKDFIAEEFEA